MRMNLRLTTPSTRLFMCFAAKHAETIEATILKRTMPTHRGRTETARFEACDFTATIG